MGDNITIKDGASADKSMAADDVGGVLYQVVKLGVGPDGQITFLSGGAGNVDPGTVRMTAASDDPMSAGGVCPTLDMTRPADTVPYTAGDSWANATSGAQAYGITNASRGDGKGGVLTDIFLSQSVAPATMLQGELWFFDTVPANPLQDNATWALTDADMAKAIAVEPFTMVSSGSSNTSSYCHLQNLNIGFSTNGGATLYVMIKVTNGYTPVSGDTLKMRPKILRWN